MRGVQEPVRQVHYDPFTLRVIRDVAGLTLFPRTVRMVLKQNNLNNPSFKLR